MKLILEVLSGPEKGRKYSIKKGSQIGRKTGDIVISDPKASAKHAHIDQAPNGDWYLIDDGSSNGIRLHGRKVPRLLLKPGTEFVIGNTAFMAYDPAAPLPLPDEASVSAHLAEAAVEPAPVVVDPDWRATLIGWINHALLASENRPQPLSALRPGLKLKFIQGLQLDTEWLVVYGPRQVGSQSFEFPIFELNAPDICFELIPTPKGINFKTSHADKVLINHQSAPSKVLKSGDIISIYESKIEVSFHK